MFRVKKALWLILSINKDTTKHYDDVADVPLVVVVGAQLLLLIYLLQYSVFQTQVLDGI